MGMCVSGFQCQSCQGGSAATSATTVPGKGAEDPEEFPGEPWDHYLVKDKTHGYKCLKCNRVGNDATHLREQSCKIPVPMKVSSSAPATPSLSGIGCSAAVVGRELSMKQLSKSDIEKEMEELQALEKQLHDVLVVQEAKEVAEAQELSELEEQMRELRMYETEEEQLQKALSESLEEDAQRSAAKDTAQGQDPIHARPVEKQSSECGGAKRKQLSAPEEPAATASSSAAPALAAEEPPAKKPALEVSKANTLDDDAERAAEAAAEAERAAVDASRKLYDPYWARWRKTRTQQSLAPSTQTSAQVVN